MSSMAVTPIPPVIYLQALVGVSLLEKEEFRNTGLIEEMRTMEGDLSTSVPPLS